jgi:hypothetical protein
LDFRRIANPATGDLGGANGVESGLSGTPRGASLVGPGNLNAEARAVLGEVKDRRRAVLASPASLPS